MFLLFVRYLHGGQEDVSAMVGRALTKTFIHSPFVIFEPSAIPLCHIWSYENKFSRPYMP